MNDIVVMNVEMAMSREKAIIIKNMLDTLDENQVIFLRKISFEKWDSDRYIVDNNSFNDHVYHAF